MALIGADPDTALLENAGVEIAPDGRPVYNKDTFETGVAGLFVAGHVTPALHISNAIASGTSVAMHVASKLVRSVFTGV